ncbi:hypothetical protein, partial [Klebsiella pneumoniae]|uniref:hypothetical protein n=1 Tax=Klebsiella pneumoniae TaxID=573 RepID=UPI0039C31DB7
SLEEQAQSMEYESTIEGEEQEYSEERPEWLPEKFSSPEDMAQAYAELEQRMGRESIEENESDSAKILPGDKSPTAKQ